MSDLTYTAKARRSPDKPLVWLDAEVRTPPFGTAARIEAGFLLRRLQRGESLGLPASRPMPVIGSACHELRVIDGNVSWRIAYHVADDAIVVLHVFRKTTRATPSATIETCRHRLGTYCFLVGSPKGARRATR